MACIGFLATEPCGGFHYGRSSHLWQAKFAESLAAMNQARRMSLPLLLVQDGRSKPWNLFFLTKAAKSLAHGLMERH